MAWRSAWLLLCCCHGSHSARALRVPAVRLMAGFEQKASSSGLERISLRVAGSAHLLKDLPNACRANVVDVEGIIYSLPSGRLEIIAEGERATLDGLANAVKAAVDAEDGAMVHLSWQLPAGGYGGDFPLVELRPKMNAHVVLHGSEGTLDYYTRHLQAHPSLVA